MQHPIAFVKSCMPVRLACSTRMSLKNAYLWRHIEWAALHDSRTVVDPRVLLQFLLHVGNKLASLHENGWTHRDLKV